jgi:hypothetical protein
MRNPVSLHPHARKPEPPQWSRRARQRPAIGCTHPQLSPHATADLRREIEEFTQGKTPYLFGPRRGGRR